LGRPDEAEPRFVRALELFEGLVEKFPGTPEYRSGLIRGLINFGNLYKRTDRPGQAGPLLRRACAEGEAALRDFRQSPELFHDAGHAHVDYAVFLREARQYKGAAASFGEAVRHFGRAVKLLPNSAEYQDDLARSHYCVAEMLEKAGDVDAAGAAYLRSVEERRKLARTHPAYRLNLVGTCINAANFYGKRKGYRKAEPLYLEAIAVGEALVREAEPGPSALAALGLAYHNYSVQLRETDRPWEAEQALDRAARLSRMRGATGSVGGGPGE
jgi:tetratricopeptide (TPR) repeat protein